VAPTLGLAPTLAVGVGTALTDGVVLSGTLGAADGTGWWLQPMRMVTPITAAMWPTLDRGMED
jgi:hypothetical protein